MGREYEILFFIIPDTLQEVLYTLCRLLFRMDKGAGKMFHKLKKKCKNGSICVK